jgi:hypothetical protein
MGENGNVYRFWWESKKERKKERDSWEEGLAGRIFLRRILEK